MTPGKTMSQLSGESIRQTIGVSYFGLYCRKCKKPISNAFSLQHHLRKFHKGEHFDVRLTKFYETLSSESRTLRRGTDFKKYLEPNNEVRRFSCKTCNQNFSRKFTFKRHLLMKKNDCCSESSLVVQKYRKSICGRFICENSGVVMGEAETTTDEEEVTGIAKDTDEETGRSEGSDRRETTLVGHPQLTDEMDIDWSIPTAIPQALCVKGNTLRERVAKFVRKDENIDVYTKLFHSFLVDEMFEDNIRQSLLKMNAIDGDSADDYYSIIIPVAKEWLYDFVCTHVESLPGNIRARILVFETKEGFFKDDAGGTTVFTLRKGLDCLWQEMRLLLKYCLNQDSTLLDFAKEEVKTFEHTQEGEITGNFDQLIGNGFIPRILMALLFQKTNTFLKQEMILRYAVLRCFIVNGEGQLKLRECGTSARITASILHLLRAGLCGYLVGLESSDLVSKANGLADKMNQCPVVHYLSPMIRKLRIMHTMKPTEKRTTVNVCGDICLGSFTIPHSIWGSAVPRFLGTVENCYERCFVGSQWRKFLDDGSEIYITGWPNLDKFHVQLIDGNKIMGENLIVTDMDQSDSLWWAEKLSAYFQVAFHGFGCGSLRLEEVKTLDLAKLRFHDGKLYYFAEPIKSPVAIHVNLGKTVEHCLPKSVTRQYLLYRYLMENWNFDMERKIFPDVDLNKTRFGRAFSEIFDLLYLPDALDVRHFWTAVSDLVFCDPKMSAGQISALESVAVMSGHSNRTHRQHYATFLDEGAEVRYSKFHAAIGEVIVGMHSSSFEKRYISKELLDRSLKFLLGSGKDFRNDTQFRMVERNANNTVRHLHLSLPCGFGKSLGYLVPTVANCLQRRRQYMRIVIVPYKFLMSHAMETVVSITSRDGKSAIDIQGYDGSEINNDKIPVRLQEDPLPNLLFLNIEAASTLFTTHKDVVMGWKTREILERIYFDEVHTILSEHGFRKAYEGIRNNVVLFQVPITTMSGSLNPMLLSSTMRYYGISKQINLMDMDIIKMDGCVGAGFELSKEEILSEECVKRAASIVRDHITTTSKCAHVICATKEQVNVCGSILGENGLEDYMIVTSENTTEEQKKIAKQWFEGRCRILISTTVALVGNENSNCNLVVVCGHLHSISCCVQAIGRLRPEQRVDGACVIFVTPRLEMHDKKKIEDSDEKNFRLLLDAGILKECDREHYMKTDSRSGLIRWLESYSECMRVSLARLYNERQDGCGSCTNCRQNSMANDDNVTVFESVENPIEEFEMTTETDSCKGSVSTITQSTQRSFPSLGNAQGTSNDTLNSNYVSAQGSVSGSTTTTESRGARVHNPYKKNRRSEIEATALQAVNKVNELSNYGRKAVDLLELLEKKCLYCNRDYCKGDECMKGCYRCGDRNHKSSSCRFRKEAAIHGKACFHCFERFGWRDRKSHNPKECTVGKRLVRLLVAGYREWSLQRGIDLQAHLSAIYITEENYLSYLHTLHERYSGEKENEHTRRRYETTIEK